MRKVAGKMLSPSLCALCPPRRLAGAGAHRRPGVVRVPPATQGASVHRSEARPRLRRESRLPIALEAGPYRTFAAFPQRLRCPVAATAPIVRRPGDTLLAQVVLWDGTGSIVPVAPNGWSLIRHDALSNGNKITSWLYSRIAGGGEPASYSWQITSQYAAGIMGAWRKASSSSPIEQSSGAATGGGSPISVTAPSLTPARNNELQVYFYGAQSFSAPIITEPGARTQHSNVRSSKEGFALAFGDLAGPAAGTASLTYSATATGSNPVMTAQAILLIPAP
jgi:hypothetical protein